MRRRWSIALVAALGIASCGGGNKPSEPLPQVSVSIRLTSPAFPDHGIIPKRFTCAGEDVSPPLRWTGVPNAPELTLTVEDIDANRFVHWMVLGIPRAVDRVAAGETPSDAMEAENSFGDRGWRGPCPPEGDPPHRYEFALYATDRPLGLDEDASPDDVHGALKKHAVAAGKLFGRFGR